MLLNLHIITSSLEIYQFQIVNFKERKSTQNLMMWILQKGNDKLLVNLLYKNKSHHTNFTNWAEVLQGNCH